MERVSSLGGKSLLWPDSRMLSTAEMLTGHGTGRGSEEGGQRSGAAFVAQHLPSRKGSPLS